MLRERPTIYYTRWVLKDKRVRRKNNIVNAYTMLFIDKDSGKSEFVTYLFCASRLPKEGWLQCCFQCARISTSDTYTFDLPVEELKAIGSNNTLAIFICPACKKAIQSEPAPQKELKMRVSTYIERIKYEL